MSVCCLSLCSHNFVISSQNNIHLHINATYLYSTYPHTHPHTYPHTYLHTCLHTYPHIYPHTNRHIYILILIQVLLIDKVQSSRRPH